MAAAIEQALAAALSNGVEAIGQIAIVVQDQQYILTHRDDRERSDLDLFSDAEAAIDLAKFDDAGKYRALKTAPTLRHGWRMQLVDLTAVARALDYFYPGRLAALVMFQRNALATTPLRATLDRQSGMYRIAAKISDEQLNELVGNFCRSDGGCLRTILWKRDERGTSPSSRLPAEKFDPAIDQIGKGASVIPLLCQEACNLLVNEARKVLKGTDE